MTTNSLDHFDQRQVCLIFRKHLSICVLGIGRLMHTEGVHKDRAGSHSMKSIIVKTDWNDVLVHTGTVLKVCYHHDL